MHDTAEQNLQRIQQLRAGRQQRCDQYMHIARDLFKPILDADANWLIPLTQEFGRLDLQIATAFYLGNEAERHTANQLVCRAPMPEVAGIRFGIFNTSIMMHHLVKFEHLMTDQAKARCEEMVCQGCQHKAGMQATDYQFHGYNDNMPAMAVNTLILAGERFGEDAWIQMGLWKLQRLAEMLSRCGLISEYNSPNYMPDTIHHLMTLYTHTRHEQVREHAGKIVKRLWADLASHWHPVAKCPAGPFSRAYLDDFNNYISPLNCLCWFLFGPEVSGITATEAIMPRPGLQCMHGNDPLEHTARMAWYATTDDALLDDAIARRFIHKDYPYEVLASAEQGTTAHSPLKRVDTQSFMQQAYSLGSASSSFLTGEQTANLYVTGNNHKDISPVLYTRYLVNDAFPGMTEDNTFHQLTHGEANLSSRASVHTVQHQQTALLGMVPHRHLSEMAVSLLRMGIIAPNAVGQFDGFVDQQGHPMNPDQPYPVGQWFGAKLGDAFVGLYPLAMNGMPDSPCHARLKFNEQYHYLEVVNLEQQASSITDKQLAMLNNGMAIELADASDWQLDIGSYLHALHEATVIEDQFYGLTRRMRYHRQALTDREVLVMTLAYATPFDGVSIRTVNGRYASSPTWQCSDIKAETLPYLAGDGFIASPGLLWDDLSNPRCEDAWAIGQTGWVKQSV